MQCYDYSDYRQPVRQASFPYSPYARAPSYGHSAGEYYNNTLHNRCTRCHESNGVIQHRQAAVPDYMAGYKEQWNQYRFRRDLWPQNMHHMYQSNEWSSGGAGGGFNRSYWDRHQHMQNSWSQYPMENSNVWSGYERNGMSSVDPLRGMAAMHDSCNQEEESLRHYEQAHYSPDIPAPRPSPARPATPPPPQVPPLPAFSQAFGSTEIGKFAEGINRSEDLTEEMVSDAIAAHSAGDIFEEWTGCNV